MGQLSKAIERRDPLHARRRDGCVMTAPFGHLLPGEELTDPESFLALHSAIAAVRPPRTKARNHTPSPKPERVVSAMPRRRQRAPLRAAPIGVAAPSTAPPPPPSSPAAAAALEAEIDCCASREHVARLAVHLARAYAGCAAICAVRPDRIEAVAAEGFEGNVGALFFPADADSLFARVAQTGEAFRGVPPAGGLDQQVLGALGRRHVREIAILPVSLRGRPPSPL